jgi:amidase
MPWRASEEEAIQIKLRSGGLTVGFYRSDSNVTAVNTQAQDRSYYYSKQVPLHPPVLRAMEELLELLKGNGNTVVPWTPYKHDYAADLIN